MDALKLGNYRLSDVEDRSQLLAVLNGLASVAAAARSHQLADQLRILVRRYMRDTQYALSVEESVRICVVAGASRRAALSNYQHVSALVQAAWLGIDSVSRA